MSGSLHKPQWLLGWSLWVQGRKGLVGFQPDESYVFKLAHSSSKHTSFDRIGWSVWTPRMEPAWGSRRRGFWGVSPPLPCSRGRDPGPELTRSSRPFSEHPLLKSDSNVYDLPSEVSSTGFCCEHLGLSLWHSLKLWSSQQMGPSWQKSLDRGPWFWSSLSLLSGPQHISKPLPCACLQFITPWTKTNFSHFKLFLSGYFVTVKQKYQIQWFIFLLST